MSRIQEKNTLASLNDRLAAYIERNQQLENENATITKQVTQVILDVISSVMWCKEFILATITMTLLSLEIDKTHDSIAWVAY